MPVKNISVVLAAFNGAKYIIKQLDSILQQTLAPAEIIICDDNSTDETVLLLKPYVNEGLVKLFVNESRLGLVNNFKKGAQLAAKDNWVVFADQDDIWIPEKLRTLAAEMNIINDENIPTLLYSDLSIIDRNDRVISPSFWRKQKIRPQKIHLATLLYGNVALGCTMMINQAMAQELLLMNSPDYFHDEWLALIAYSFGKVKILNEPLVQYRQHESNVTFSEDYKTPGFFDRVNQSLKFLAGRKKFLGRQFNLAKAFLSVYQGKIGEQQMAVFENFINQENKSYLLQRLNRKITYK